MLVVVLPVELLTPSPVNKSLLPRAGSDGRKQRGAVLLTDPIPPPKQNAPGILLTELPTSGALSESIRRMMHKFSGHAFTERCATIGKNWQGMRLQSLARTP